jgi:hypothetical protein
MPCLRQMLMLLQPHLFWSSIFFGFPKAYISVWHNIATSLSLGCEYYMWIHSYTIVCPHSFWMLYITQNNMMNIFFFLFRLCWDAWWKCWNLSLLKWKIKISLHCHLFMCALLYFIFPFNPHIHLLTHHVELLHITHSFHAFDHCWYNVCVWANQRVERNALDLRFA